MINQTFVHCPGIGLKTENRLKSLGFDTWEDCLNRPEDIPFRTEKKKLFLDLLSESQEALKNHDISYFVSKLPTKEHWRILGTYYQQATYFDIETTGLSPYDSFTTLIVAYHKDKLYTFLYGENLDAFLQLIDESVLLVAFNGNSFDVPFLEHSFNIPDIGCPYIDLRWIAYHQGYSGGLKAIEKEMGLFRPRKIGDIDGFEAVRLFYEWQAGDISARDKLIGYCQADVLSTCLVSEQIIREIGISIPRKHPEQIYKLLEL
ncbi:ribonuclease H-like domain-containing protein [bacterium]|nr:ribonuclease H-like domain-containing protein [bacterium]